MAAVLDNTTEAATPTSAAATNTRWTATGLLESFLQLFQGKGLELDSIDFSLGDEDADCLGRGAQLFLDKYTPAQLTELLHDTPGLVEKLEASGFRELLVRIDAADSFVHHFYLYDDGPHELEEPACNIWPRLGRDTDQERRRQALGAPACLLMELSVRLRHNLASLRASCATLCLPESRSFFKSTSWLPSLHLLEVEWLLLQNPTRSPRSTEHMLPGQRYPGLQVGREVGALLVQLSEQEAADGIVSCPLYFHNAVLYANNGCIFVNPELQGAFETLCADLEDAINDPNIGLAMVSRAIFHGRLIYRPTGQRVRWLAQEQVFPLSSRLKALICSETYTSVARRFVSHGMFEIDWCGSPPASDAEWADTVAMKSLAHLFADNES